MAHGGNERGDGDAIEHERHKGHGTVLHTEGKAIDKPNQKADRRAGDQPAQSCRGNGGHARRQQGHNHQRHQRTQHAGADDHDRPIGQARPQRHFKGFERADHAHQRADGEKQQPEPRLAGQQVHFTKRELHGRGFHGSHRRST